MFTSRAEYRLLLREDNADLRLTAKGRELGLINDARWEAICRKREAIEHEQQRLSSTWLRPEVLDAQAAVRVLGKPLQREASLMELLRRPEVTYKELMTLPGCGDSVTDVKVAEQVEIQAKYAGYIERQHNEIARSQRHAEQRLPQNIDYQAVKNLSSEVRQKLAEVRPATIGQAARIPGVTPAAISLLLIHLKKHAALEQKSA